VEREAQPLQDILDNIKPDRTFLRARTLSDIAEDERTLFASEYALLIISEAAKRLGTREFTYSGILQLVTPFRPDSSISMNRHAMPSPLHGQRSIVLMLRQRSVHRDSRSMHPLRHLNGKPPFALPLSYSATQVATASDNVKDQHVSAAPPGARSQRRQDHIYPVSRYLH
jgi:hypothetical protein